MFEIRIIHREKDGERKRKIQWTEERKKTLNERIGHGREEKKELDIKKEVSVNIMPSVDANTSLLRRKTELSLLLPPLYVWTGRKPEPLIPPPLGENLVFTNPTSTMCVGRKKTRAPRGKGM